MDQIGNLLDRPRLYYNIDGLVELGGGLLSLGIALLLSLPANSVWHKLSWFVLLALALAIPRGINAIKTRITYPRTGFVEYRHNDRRRTSVMAAMAGALIPVGLVIAIRSQRDMTTPASLAGLILAVAYAYGVARAVRWKWVVVCAIALGSIVIGFLPAEVLAAMANDSLVTHPFRAKLGGTIVASFMTYGALLLISGGVSFWLYLRHTQAPAQDGR